MSASPPTIHEHPANPAWGRGTIIEQRDGKAVLQFEHGGRKVVVVRALGMLKRVDLPREAAIALDARLRGRRAEAGARALKAKKAAKALKSGKVEPVSAGSRSPFASFEAQVAAFDLLFPGGFQGEKFVEEERGAAGYRGKKRGYKEAAIELASEGLSPARFEKAGVDEIFAAVKSILQVTNIVHPQEGGIALAGLSAAAQVPLVAALKALLHGAGEYAPRFDAFVGAFALVDKAGKAKAVTWPLATLLPAAYRPAEHVPVKPTYFRWQAALVGVDVIYQSDVGASVYEQFLEVARATSKRLVAAGHAPRDLMDVYSFIWRTQSAKSPAVEAAVVATPAA